MMKKNGIVFRTHAIKRMFERQIDPRIVLRILETGEVIENYVDDIPYPSRLILGWQGSRPIHVVVADNEQNSEIIVITAYEPTANLWSKDFKRRKL